MDNLLVSIELQSLAWIKPDTTLYKIEGPKTLSLLVLSTVFNLKYL